MKKYLLLIFMLQLVISCNNKKEIESSEATVSNDKYEEISNLQWLLGTWTNETVEQFSQESWSKENDSTYTAYSFVEVKGEVVFAETMALEQKAGDLLLTVETANQNDQKPITFKMISSEKGQVTFENKNHDFPERIIYSNPAKDSLHAWIEGTINEEAKKVDFYFSRKN